MLACSSYLFFFWISVTEAAPLMGLECVLQHFYSSTRFRLTPSLRRYTEILRNRNGFARFGFVWTGPKLAACDDVLDAAVRH